MDRKGLAKRKAVIPQMKNHIPKQKTTEDRGYEVLTQEFVRSSSSGYSRGKKMDEKPESSDGKPFSYVLLRKLMYILLEEFGHKKVINECVFHYDV
jgi:hypothetical protein